MIVVICIYITIYNLTCHFDSKRKQLNRKNNNGTMLIMNEVIRSMRNALFNAPTISRKIVPGVTNEDRNRSPWYKMYRNDMFSLILMTFLQSISRSMMFAIVDGDQRRLWL